MPSESRQISVQNNGLERGEKLVKDTLVHEDIFTGFKYLVRRIEGGSYLFDVSAFTNLLVIMVIFSPDLIKYMVRRISDGSHLFDLSVYTLFASLLVIITDTSTTITTSTLSFDRYNASVFLSN